MTKQEQEKKRKLAERVKLFEASAKVLYEEATDIRRELEDLYPPEVSKKWPYELSAEDKARTKAGSYARRNIPLNDNQ